MAAGFALRLSADGYLVLGVPVLLIFQLGIARRPLSEVWFPAGTSWRLPGWAWAAAAGFAALPLHHLWSHPGARWDVKAWDLCAVLGSIPLAASLPQLNRDRWEWLKLCLASAGAIGVAFDLLAFFAQPSAAPAAASARLLAFSQSLVMYVPVSFLLEEVFFRGALDGYLRRARDDDKASVFSGALWGFWHLPLIAGRAVPPGLAAALVAIVITDSLVGSFLGIYRRRSGLLLVPAFTHALIDAVRNALLR